MDIVLVGLLIFIWSIVIYQDYEIEKMREVNKELEIINKVMSEHIEELNTLIERYESEV